MKQKTLLAILFFALVGLATAQTPTGAVAGVVRDPSGAAVAGALVNLMSTGTGLERSVLSSEQGDYAIAVLPTGDYEVRAQAPGFQRIVRAVSVEAGVTTTTDFELRVGEITDSVTVDATAPQMQYDSNSIGGWISRSQVEDLPLNGRSFLELAKLDPGGQAPTRTSSNRMFVPVLGSPGGGNNGRATRVTIDGGSIMAVGNGGSAMGFSQEGVQEFRISSVNFDLSTGPTFSGAVNVVTRSGGNDLHGTAFYFFRDHKLAAYPALIRDPADPDPFFQRRQFGFALGGPIRRDRAFFFFTWERNEQRGVSATTLSADFGHLSRVTPSPIFGNQASLRLDGRISSTQSAFLRYSHDGSRGFGPSANQANTYPSYWTRQLGWSDQSIFGLTSVLRPTVVNDLRFSYFFVSSSQLPPTERDCRGCLGIGAPAITVPQAGLFIGGSDVQRTLGRRLHLSDTVSWQRGTHRTRFGVDWEYNRGGVLNWNNDPVSITLFSPRDVRAYNALPQTTPDLRIPLPAVFDSLNAILQLPLQRMNVGIGDPRVPQANGGMSRTWNTLRLFFTDTWRFDERLTVNYGLGWSMDRNLNYDLAKPTLLAPILGNDGLGPTRKEWANFSPVLGIAWAPSRDARTVIRAGGGIFYDFLFQGNLDNERALLGPPGLGRQSIPGSSIANPLPGIPGVEVGRTLDFPVTPTLFTGATLMTILPEIRATLAKDRANADPSVRAIQINKQGTLNPADVPSGSAQHMSVGFQRQIATDFVLSTDFAYRHFLHVARTPDLNHYDSIRGPVIPKCVGEAQIKDPQAFCSNGQINVQESSGRSTYKGLLVRADKRFSHGFQLLGSYAYSSSVGTNAGSGFDLDNRLASVGPLATDYTHIANLAGVVQLPRGFQLGWNFSYSSVPPISASVGGIDFNGDGTTNDLLPGTKVNEFNRGLGRTDLVRLVDQFNSAYAGKVDAQGSTIRRLTLPASYSLGDDFHSLDVRLSRSFLLNDRWRLSLIGEAFNLYNAANLTGYTGNLTRADFGQPTSRFTQVFGSGGPRSFQFATRVSF